MRRRTVFRLWAMRRTLFLAAMDDVPVVHAAAARAVAEMERRRTLGMLADAGIGPEAARLLGELEAIGLEAIRERGEAATAELRELDPRLDRRITTARGKSYEGTISIASKVAFHLALDDHIGRDRPRGTWVSGQFRWSPVERWLPDGIRELPVDAARRARATLAAHLRPRDPRRHRVVDRLGVGATRQALAAVGAVEVRLRQRRPDDLGRGAHRWRLGAAAERRDRGAPAREGRHGDRPHDRCRSRAPGRLARPDPDQMAVPLRAVRMSRTVRRGALRTTGRRAGHG